ncbi:MAG: DUF169 domain-containing protein [Candidatus Helarchaeota archaeon]|nr:DUF169 domain-containing protein [Candidatus Helarchaeota archaeon]
MKTKFLPVGISIITDGAQSWDASFLPVNSGERFCYYVRQASQGQKFVILKNSNLECYTPFLCLGFEEPKNTEFEPRIKSPPTTAVLIAPLNGLDNPLDSILFIVDAKQAMILIASLRRVLGKKVEFSCGASMAICGEIVAHTVINQTPNLSVLCGGARIFSGYTDNELVLGIPPNLLEQLYLDLKKHEKLMELKIN